MNIICPLNIACILFASVITSIPIVNLKNLDGDLPNFDQEILHYLNNSKLNGTITKLSDVVPKNYEKTEDVLQHTMSIFKNSSHSDRYPVKNIKNVIKRSNSIANQNETDVEYQKYGGYISTKIYQPLGITQPSIKLYLAEKNNKTFNLDDQILSDDLNTIINLYKGNETTKSQHPKQNKETFVKLLDNYFNDNNQTNNLEQAILNKPNRSQNNISEYMAETTNLNENLVNLKPKISVNHYHTKYSSGDNYYEQKTSIVTVKQILDNVDNNLKNSSKNLTDESNIFSVKNVSLNEDPGVQLNENIMALNRGSNLVTKESEKFITEDTNLDQKLKFKIIENEVSNLAKNLLLENTKEPPLSLH